MRSRSIILSFWLAAAPVLAATPPEYDLKIERQPLGGALQEFAMQSGLQIIFFSIVTDGHEAPALNGRFTAAAALKQLLNGSKLTFCELNPRTIEVQSRVRSSAEGAGAAITSRK